MLNILLIFSEMSSKIVDKFWLQSFLNRDISSEAKQIRNVRQNFSFFQFNILLAQVRNVENWSHLKNIKSTIFHYLISISKFAFIQIPTGDTDGPEKKITRLAIGTPGGFNPDKKKYTYDESYKIVILPNFTSILYPNDKLPMQVHLLIILIFKTSTTI